MTNNRYENAINGVNKYLHGEKPAHDVLCEYAYIIIEALHKAERFLTNEMHKQTHDWAQK